MAPTQGIVYVATGKKYIDAAAKSAVSVRKHMSGIPIHLFADWRQQGFRFDESPHPFTTVGEIIDPHPRSKVDYLAQTPFDWTLYLDSDTALNADISEMFRLLERFDLAMAHAHRRNSAVRQRTWRIELPYAFPQFNSGVFLYRKTPDMLHFLESWGEAFQQAGFPQDQITLRELLWLSDLRIATLPPEYNVRFLKYLLIWRRTEARPMIYHLQYFHDGPLWFVKGALKQSGRRMLKVLGLEPARVRRMLKK
ncbi:MAG: hypothetical protein HPY85_07755 [Anaerolineae bacterium]|nr:hypothetical protein [Anaerolineae bacterium]